MTDYILSLDPGESVGAALLSYESDSPPVLEGAYQFRGGAEAMRDWISRLQIEPFVGLNVFDLAWVEPENVICEAFSARDTQGFSYTTASLEALPVIGVLIDRGLVDRSDRKRYVDPKFQYLVGGKDLADKKKRRDLFLKESGFYVTPKSLGQPDANDARSAISHGISYLARTGHKPSFELISDWSEKNGN